MSKEVETPTFILRCAHPNCREVAYVYDNGHQIVLTCRVCLNEQILYSREEKE